MVDVRNGRPGGSPRLGAAATLGLSLSRGPGRGAFSRVFPSCLDCVDLRLVNEKEKGPGGLVHRARHENSRFAT